MQTKERILKEALELFAARGYDAASMSDIAARLGITKGALYRHFDGKRAILDAIIARMQERDREQAQSCNVPEDALEQAGDSYAQTSITEIKEFSLAQFRYWTEDAFASAFRRMLALERYKDAGMMGLYQNYLCAGPLKYMEDLFREMSGANPWRAEDAPVMALEFYGPMYILMDIADEMQDQAAALARLEVQIDRFIQKYTQGGEEA